MSQKTKENKFGAFTIDEMNKRIKYNFEFDRNEVGCIISGLLHEKQFLDKQMNDRSKRSAYKKAFELCNSLITFFSKCY